MHILLGLLGTQWFDWTAGGFLFCIGIVSVTQASDLLRVYMDKKRNIENGPAKSREAELEKFKKEFQKTLPSSFFQNLIMYTAIVLFSAEIGRTSGYGV
ncbi:MAG: hypothetical protein OEV42_03270 [Deltaproteobacteria bacterium]|nr:hypothetical protein [Deltaproteobacteria bacterium]